MNPSPDERMLLLASRCRMVVSRLVLLCSLLSATVSCGSLPRDPERTTDRVRKQHQIRVGLVENSPWVTRADGQPAGVEVALVRSFAVDLGAEITWFWGSEQRHMEALEQFELDLLVSGLDQTTPWSKHVGLTRPYYEEEFLLGMPPGSRVPDSLRGIETGVREGDVAAAYLRKAGAVPVRREDLFKPVEPVAAPAWLLEQRGYTRTKFVLFQKKHVMAVAPGENGWLKLLGDYLEKQKSSLPNLIRREARP